MSAPTKQRNAEQSNDEMLDAIADLVRPVKYGFHLTRSVVETIQFQRSLTPGAAAEQIAAYLDGVVGWTKLTELAFVQRVFAELDKSAVPAA